MLNLGAGATAGISAILIPQLKHAKGKHKFTTEMVSWVGMCKVLIFLILKLTIILKCSSKLNILRCESTFNFPLITVKHLDDLK